MRFSEIIAEALPAGFVHNMGHITDLRVTDTKDYRGKKPAQLVVLTRDGGAIIYNWGDHNTVPWSKHTKNGAESDKTIMDMVESDIDLSLQHDITDIAIYRTGFLINPKRDNHSWSANRNVYSSDFHKMLQALVERGLATPQTPIWFGNWASHQGEPGGTIRKILSVNVEPKRLILYHGTSTARLPEIMRSGLHALDKSERVWKDRVSATTEHRGESVYLTPLLNIAQYYADKSARVDKVRLNKVDTYRATTTNPKILTIQKMRQEMETNQPEPVILKVVLGEADMKKLMADDDHLQRNPDANPNDWRYSLEHFGQVAYRGTIPPQRIKIIKK